MRRLGAALLTLFVIGNLAACGSSTPASPTSPSSMAGATITGSLVSPGGSGGTTGASILSSPGPSVVIPTGLTVTVSSTGVSASIDVNGNFVLRDVPAGPVLLRFTGPGVSATLTLTSVQTGQSVTITVSLTSTSATLETDRRSGSDGEEVEGRVESLPPTTAPLTFVVAGRTVTTDTSTKFFLNGAPATFASLAIGQRVHVKGKPSGGSLLATTVDIQNTNADLPVNLNGVISSFTGTATAFSFVVNGQTVKGDNLTEFFGNSSFSDLANGVTVEVKGAQRDAFVYAVRIHVDTEAEDTEFEGVIASITGTSPTLTLVVGGKTVKTTASTVVRRKGDVQTLASLQVGQTVDVSGSLQLDGTITAKQIGIEDDAVGGQFEMTGTLAGLSGSCPAIAFSVSGYSITTSSTTTFSPSCSVLTNGTSVKVEGIVQAGGSIKATKVEKQ